MGWRRLASAFHFLFRVQISNPAFRASAFFITLNRVHRIKEKKKNRGADDSFHHDITFYSLCYVLIMPFTQIVGGMLIVAGVIIAFYVYIPLVNQVFNQLNSFASVNLPNQFQALLSLEGNVFRLLNYSFAAFLIGVGAYLILWPQQEEPDTGVI